MKKTIFTALAVAVFCFLAAITSVTDGDWDNPEIWDSNSVPSAMDDVIVTRLITIGETASCNNLTLSGGDAMVRNHQMLNGTLNIYGDLVSTGWIASNNVSSRNLTCNLYGNLESYYNFTPGTLNVLGSGNRTWCMDEDSYLSVWSSINIASTIDTIFATGDINISCSHASANTMLGVTDSLYTMVMQDPVTRLAHNLRLKNTTVQYGRFIGNGSNTLIWDNNRNGYLQYSCLNDMSVSTVSTMLVAHGVVFHNITNNGTIYNLSSANRTLELHGAFTNNGSIRSNPGGYNLNLNCFGDVLNNGYFAPADMQFLGTSDHSIACTATNPFKVQNNLSIATTTGTIRALSNLVFEDTDYIYNGTFSLVSDGRDGWDISISNTSFSGSVILGAAGSELIAVNTAFGNSSLHNLVIPAVSTASFLDGSSLSNCQNYGIIQNSNTYRYTLNIVGDFTNHGTIRNHPSGYDLTVNANANLVNLGTWSNKALNLTGSETQTISFPQGHSLQANVLSCTGPASSVVIAAGEDLYADNCELDFNSKDLLMPDGAHGLYLNNCQFKEAEVISSLSNFLHLINTNIQQCSFHSITNNQYFTILSHTTVNGSFVNNGTVQNSSASNFNFTVNGDLTNNGIIRNNSSGYSLSCFVKGNVLNNGTFSCQSLSLESDEPQSVFFPSEHPFQGTNLIKTNAISALSVTASLHIKNCTVDLNGSQLIMNSAGNWNLNLDNCVFKECALVSNLGSNLSMVNGGYLQDVSFQSLHFSGTVSLNSDTTISGTLVNDGILKNLHSYHQNLYVNDLVNNGTIQDSPSGYSLKPHIMHTFANNGSISTATLYFDGMNCSISSSGTISCGTLTVSNASAVLSILDNLSLSNLYLGFHASRGTLDLVNGEAGITLGMSGGSITNAIIQGGYGATLNGSNYFILRNTQANELEISGTVLVESVSIDYLKNYGIIKNSTAVYQTMQIGICLENHGTVSNNTSYNLSLVLGGSLLNYGTINIQSLAFNAMGNQTACSSGIGNVIQTSSLSKLSGSGDLIMASDLAFRNTYINLNGQNLRMHDGRSSYDLSVEGGNISNTILATSGFSGLQMSANAYLNNISGGDLIFSGIALLHGSNSFTNVVNNGELRNYSSTYSSISVSGDFVNNGLVANGSSYHLSVYVGKHLQNNSDISCYAIYLNGTSAQNVLRGGACSPNHFYLNSNIGSAQWYLDGELSTYSGSTIDIPIANNSCLGLWQAYNTDQGVWGRLIYIAAGGEPVTPVNLQISYYDTNIILAWDQAPFATSYRLYASDEPESGFSLLLDNITDSEPNDGIVQISVPISAEKSFYRVTARN